jgi:hypothetical protein
MARETSERDLRNRTAGAVEADRVEPRDPWVASAALRHIRREAAADPGLLDDLASVRCALVDDA